MLYAKSTETLEMMSIGLLARLMRHPGRFRALQRFLDHLEAHDYVWVTRRVDIALHAIG